MSIGFCECYLLRHNIFKTEATFNDAKKTMKKQYSNEFTLRFLLRENERVCFFNQRKSITNNVHFSLRFW